MIVPQAPPQPRPPTRPPGQPVTDATAVMRRMPTGGTSLVRPDGPEYGTPLYHLRAALNGLLGALQGRAFEGKPDPLVDEMRATITYLDEHVHPETQRHEARIDEAQRLLADAEDDASNSIWITLEEVQAIRAALEGES